VPKVRRAPSATTFSSKRFGFHTWPLARKNQRTASTPTASKSAQGSTALPRDLDIFLACASSSRLPTRMACEAGRPAASPWRAVTSARCSSSPDTKVDSTCSV
jgi:hypothetical protein